VISALAGPLIAANPNAQSAKAERMRRMSSLSLNESAGRRINYIGTQWFQARWNALALEQRRGTSTADGRLARWVLAASGACGDFTKEARRARRRLTSPGASLTLRLEVQAMGESLLRALAQQWDVLRRKIQAWASKPPQRFETAEGKVKLGNFRTTVFGAASRRRRSRAMNAGILLVLFGFILQLMGTWPGCCLFLGIRPAA
jgi:hypothetical protein